MEEGNIIKAIANEPTRTLQGDPKLQVYRTVWKQYFTAIPCDDGKIDIETLDAHLAHAKRSGWTVLVAFDDLLAAQRNPKVTDLFVSGRHSGIDTATLCQTLKTGNRTARINASLFWCFNMSEKALLHRARRPLDHREAPQQAVGGAGKARVRGVQRPAAALLQADRPGGKAPGRVSDKAPTARERGRGGQRVPQ